MKRIVVLALLVLGAVAIPVSTVHGQAKEEIKLTTIIPDQQVLRVKKGYIGEANYDPNIFPDTSIQAKSLLVEGNVGIGTTTPGSKLMINYPSSSTISDALTLENIASGLGTGSRLTYSTKAGHDHAFIQSQYVDGTTFHDLEFGVGGGGNIDGTVKMVVLGSGNVGIGTTTPQATLSVGSLDQINFYRPLDNVLAIQTTLDDHPLGTFGGNTENRLVLQPLVGNVGIGTTNPTNLLTIKAGGSGTVEMGQMSDATSYGAIAFSPGGTISSANYALAGYFAGPPDTIPAQGATLLNAATTIKLRINNVDKVTIDTNGIQIFGAWQTMSNVTTIYQAPTDGLVIAHGGDVGNIYGYTDSTPACTTLRIAETVHTGGAFGECSITMPVRKGDYWKITSSIAMISVYWLPLGK